jgi:hypothetical protein
VPARRLEDGGGADHVGRRAEDRVGDAERHLQGGEVDDRVHRVLRHRRLDRLRIGDVAGDPGNPGDLVLRHQERRPPRVGREVERHHRHAGAHEQRQRPSVQEPMQPPAPVTRTGPSKSAALTGNLSSMGVILISGIIDRARP